MNYAGIDPGKNGGIVTMDGAGNILWAEKMPVSTESGKKEYDIRAATDMIARWMDLELDPTTSVMVEKLHALPPTMGGSIANFERGFSMGWVWALSTCGIEPTLVDPRRWQRVMLEGFFGTDTKDRAYRAAVALWGEADWMIPKGCRKPHDGIIDAALICEYGRRQSAVI